MDNKNLPAYPLPCAATETGVYVNYHANVEEAAVVGLTKREVVAAMCLQGMIANHGDSGAPFHTFAEIATAYADALLTHLSNTNK